MGTANKGNQSFEILGIGDLGGATAWIQREKEGDKTKLACFTRANASEGIGKQNQHEYMLVREDCSCGGGGGGGGGIFSLRQWGERQWLFRVMCDLYLFTDE